MGLGLSEIIEVLGEFAPIILEGAQKEPFQTIILSSAGRIDVWDEALQVLVDGTPIALDKVLYALESATDQPLTFDKEAAAFIIHCGSLKLVVTPTGHGPESIVIWTTKRDILVY